MPTQTTAPTTSLPVSTDLSASPLPPVLLAATPTGTAGDMSITLDFSTAMAAGSGTIYITDGAVQTVIDRATGQPTLRVVGATDTHKLAASSLVIDGAHVKLDVAGLLAGHTYSVVMGPDVLQSSGHVAFGGVRSTSQLQFTTPDAPDTQAPTLVSIDTDGATLKAGGSIAVTLKFSEAVANLPAAALNAPHATISSLSTSDGGITWHATLAAPADPTTAAGNVLTLDMSKVADAAGNHGSGTSNVASYAVDTQGPTATVTLDGALLAAGHDAVATITFSEAVKDLPAAALGAGHATVSNVHTTDGGTTWLATLGGNAATTAGGNVLAVDLGQVHDLAGNAGSGSVASSAYTVDTQGPSSVAIALDGTTLASSNSVHATFTFSEAVKDLPLAAIAAPHAHVTGLATADGGKTWTATVAADGTGTWTGNAISVDLGKVHDLAGNAGSGSATSAAYAVDTQGPTATLALDSAALHTGSSATLTIQFSEAVKDLTAAALQAPNGALANLQHSADYKTWTATLTPQAGVTDASNAVSLDLAKVHDAVGNAGSGSVSSGNYAVDTQGPSSVAIALDGATLASSNSIHATFTFSEAVKDLPLAAIAAPHAHVTGLATADGGKTWTATLTADGTGTWTGNAVSVDLGKVHDLAGNAGSGSATSAAYTVDTVAPLVAGIALDNTNLDATHGATLTIRFTEAVADLGMDAISTPHAAVSGLRTTDGGITWTGTLASNDAAPSSGNVVAVDLAKVRDLAGNAGSGSAQSDTYAVAGGIANTAAIALDGTTLDGSHTIRATITFAQAVRDLPLSALSAPHASVSGLASADGGKTWTATLAASGSGEWTGNVVGVDLTQVQDQDGHPGLGHAWSGAYAVDTAGPAGVAIALGGSALDAGGTMSVTFTFTEAVGDLAAAAISAPGTTVGDVRTTDGGKTWTAQLGAADGVDAGGLRVALDLGQVHDLHGNAGAGLVASDATYAVDSKRPTVTDILFDDTAIGPARGIGFTITFSESVSGLTAAALQAPHAQVGNLATTDGGKTWTGTLAAEDGATSSTGNQLGVDLTQVHDAAGNAGSGTAASLSHYSVNADPLAATVSLDGDALASGGSVGVTIRFSAPVTVLDASAFTTPHAALSNLRHSDDNLTWYATLSAADAGVVDTTNVVGLDLTRVHDTLGNAGTGTASSGNYTLDTTVAAYVSQIYVSDAGPYADDGVTNVGNEYIGGYFTGTLAGTQHLQVTIDGQDVDPDGLHVVAQTDGLTAWYYQGEAILSEGAHTLTARLVDDDGHASATVSKQVTIDTTNPHLTGSPDGSAAFDVAGNLVLTFDEAVYWRHGESSYDGVQLYDHDGDSTYVTLTESNFSSDHKTITLTPDELHLGTGNDYSLYLPYTLTDLAGNQVSYDGISFHTAGNYVDVTPPRATFLRADAGGGDYGVGKTIQISVTFSEPVNVAGDGLPVLHLDNGATATFLDTSTDHRTAVFTYTVQAGDQDSAGLGITDRSDLAGHFADGAGHLLDLAHITFGYLADSDGYAGTIRIDAHAPDAPPAPHLATWSDTGTAGDDITSVMAPGITGSGAEAFARIDLYAGDHLAGSGWADDHGNWTIDTVVLGTNGTYTLKAVQYDDAGNASAQSQALTVTVAGATAATAALDGDNRNGSSASANLTNNTAPTLGGTVAAGTKVAVWDGSTKLGSTTADGIGVWHFTPGYGLANGQHTITLELTDTSGNVTPRELSTPFTFTIDSIAPDAPGKPVLATESDTGVSSIDGITYDTTPTLTGKAAEGGGKIEVYEGDTLLGSADVGNDGGWSFTLATDKALADGVHALTVRQVDAAGNRSEASTPLAITIDTTAPTIAVEHSYTKFLKNWHSLEFSEKVVFAKDGAIDVLDTGNLGRSHHAWDVLTNWDITTNEQGVLNTLELNLGTLNGIYHLQVTNGALQDVAGNVAIVGTPTFYVGVAS